VALIAFGPSLGGRFSIERHLVCLALALGVAGAAPGVGVLAFGSLFIGAGAAVAQRLLATAAQVAGPAASGTAIGRVVACALIAVLGVKLFGAGLAQAVGWRQVFYLAIAAVMLANLFSAVSRPAEAPRSAAPASETIASLWRSSALLRRATLQQAALFAAFNAAWMIALVQVQPGERAAAVIGGGCAGLVAAMVAGRFSDRGNRGDVALMGAVALLLAAAVVLPVAYGLGAGWARTALLLVGMGMVDGGLQIALVANQARVQALRPAMRSRLAATLTVYGSLGGALGAGTSYWLWAGFGWPAALGFTAVAACLGVACSVLPAARVMSAI
jgi:predicted MFS family arabinose efflux permease